MLPAYVSGFLDELQKISEVRNPRHRVEVYAVKDGKVLAGRYSDGSMGTYGGGVDPGETAHGAARREFTEESGYRLSRVGRVGVPTLVQPWIGADPSKGDRKREFDGIKTDFLYGVPSNKPRVPLDEEDHATVLSDIRWRSLPGVIRAQKRAMRNAEGEHRDRMETRLAVFNSLHKKFGV
jgi:8-oxo-dGTP pyrophosphatase MutT (NUDIX family)